MAVPNFERLMLPVLKRLNSQSEINVPVLSEQIANDLNMSSADREALLPSGAQQVLNNRIGWSIKYMQRAGLVKRTRRAFYTITDLGKDELAKDLSYIDKSYLMKFPDFVAWKRKNTREKSDVHTSSKVEDSDLSPEEQIEQSYQIIHDELKDQILEHLTSDAVTFFQFEGIVVDLLIAMGYGNGKAEMGEALKRTNDHGIDGVIKEDNLGLDMVYIQAKNYQENSGLGRPDIQKFVGSLEEYSASKGVFVTTSYFAKSAREYVDKVSKRIILIDGQYLAELMIKYNVGVTVKQTYQIKKFDENLLSE